MEVHNKVNPSEQQMAEFMEPGHEEPIYMLNLLKFKAVSYTHLTLPTTTIV